MNICTHCKILLRVFFISTLLILSVSINLTYPPVLIQLLILPLIFSSVRSVIIIYELITVALVCNILYLFTDNMIAVNLPIISTSMIILAYSATRNMAVYLTYIFNTLLIGIAIYKGVNVIDVFLITLNIFNLLINFKSFLYKDDEGDNKIALVADTKIINKDILRHLEKVAKKEKREIKVIENYELENYKYVIAISENGKINYEKLRAKRVLYLYNGAFFDDNVGMEIFVKSAKNSADFYGRYNIRRVIKNSKRKDVDIERVRIHAADFMNGAKVGLPAYVNLSPNILAYKLLKIFKQN